MALSNADFRNLLNDADRLILTETNDKKKKPVRTDAAPSSAQLKRRERYLEILRRRQHKTTKGGKEDDEGESSLYRDRANERRHLADALYAQAADELAEMKERSVEESKYLGGDVEHTHLVKGLDLALLSKVKAELEKTKLEIKKSKVPEEQSTARAKPTLFIKDDRARNCFDILFKQLNYQQSRFSKRVTQMEQRIMTGISQSKGGASGRSYRDGMLTYRYKMDPSSAESSFIPILIRKSAIIEENPDTTIRYYAPVQPKIVDEITVALQWHKENRKKKKEDRLPRRPTTSVTNRQNGSNSIKKEDDEDIFSGVSKYDGHQMAANAAEYAKSQKVKQSLELIRDVDEMDLDDGDNMSNAYNMNGDDYGLKKNRVFFDSKDTENDDRGKGSLFRRDENLFKRKIAEDAREKDPAFISNTYAECYPGYGAGYIREYASDDEDNTNPLKMTDTGEYRDVFNNKRNAKNKSSQMQFESKEAYEHYLSNIEYIPKGATQYGRRHNSYLKAKKQKLTTQQEWSKIEKIIADKY